MKFWFYFLTSIHCMLIFFFLSFLFLDLKSLLDIISFGAELRLWSICNCKNQNLLHRLGNKTSQVCRPQCSTLQVFMPLAILCPINVHRDVQFHVRNIENCLLTPDKKYYLVRHVSWSRIIYSLQLCVVAALSTLVVLEQYK